MLNRFLPRLISWNTTYECNLRCEHCYIDAVGVGEAPEDELTTEEGKMLIDQISEISKCILVLSGGEPLLRKDIFDIAKYGTEKGLRIVMGTNGTLIDDKTAKKLKESGVMRVGISIDAVSPEVHDDFRGVKGCHRKAIEGAKACFRNGLSFQIHTTVTRSNYEEIPSLIDLAVDLGADAFHLFFLVPTGRGEGVEDVTPKEYEEMLLFLYKKQKEYEIEIKAVCAPQFMRIAEQEGGKHDFHLERYTRGCLAGTNYCRIKPDGEVNPCPYLPISVGNIKEKPFGEIWRESEVFKNLRDFSKLKGKCGSCRYNSI
ncbi:MAG: radical SAM protein, partial [Candidatus Syntropharchaeia archaeon]